MTRPLTARSICCGRARRLDRDRRHLVRHRAVRPQLVGQRGGLLLGPRHQHPPAEQRLGLEPGQLVARRVRCARRPRLSPAWSRRSGEGSTPAALSSAATGRAWRTRSAGAVVVPASVTATGVSGLRPAGDQLAGGGRGGLQRGARPPACRRARRRPPSTGSTAAGVDEADVGAAARRSAGRRRRRARRPRRPRRARPRTGCPALAQAASPRRRRRRDPGRRRRRGRPACRTRAASMARSAASPQPGIPAAVDAGVNDRQLRRVHPARAVRAHDGRATAGSAIRTSAEASSLDGAQRQQPRVTGTGTEEGDVSGCGRRWRRGAQGARSPIRPAAPSASIRAASSRPRAIASSCDVGTGPVVDSCTSEEPSVVPTTPRRRIS